MRERELPDADDDFAQLASEFDTLDELKADLRERVGRVKVLEQGVAGPRQGRSRSCWPRSTSRCPRASSTPRSSDHFDDGHGDDDHRAEVDDAGARVAQAQFVLDEIADKEQLAVSEDELSE